MKQCKCRKPAPFLAPQKARTCVRCALHISPEWTCNDQTVAGFFDRLEDAVPGGDGWLESFRKHCEQRELAGRDKWGFTFLARENTLEGLEEACDGALYSMLDVLKARREGRGEEDLDAALTAAYYFGKAHEALRRLRDKRLGAP